ncbi:MAG: DnaJ domain-containing protein [Desulfonauticus sp.]|nr:DnaJ domain-containing protein [Desulfonauticus sp.]
MSKLDAYFQILELSPQATLEDLKRNYRRLAFKYHPDLNTADPDATRKFQEINIAYVTLKQHLHSRSASQKTQNFNKGSKKDNTTSFSRTQAKQTYARQSQQSFYRSNKREPRYSSTRDTYRKHFYASQEEILQQILEDPFARQVFEDIFNRVQNKKRSTPLRYLQQIKQQIFSWWHSQLDYEHEIYIPAYKIKPGTKIKVNIGQKFGPNKQIELTIPPGYKPGQTIRLKKLGRKLGAWQGDLYLKIKAQSELK